MHLAQIISMMVATNLIFWFASNLQFLIKDEITSFIFCIFLGSLASGISFFTSKLGYGKFSMWELRIMAFAASYATFPVLAWKFFGEPITHPKTVTSIFISIVLICVQVLWK